ncbi:unnamed protein product, partial [Rotaria magnacalcarata]
MTHQSKIHSIEQDSSVDAEMISNIVSSDEKAMAPEVSSTVQQELTEEQLENVGITEDKESLIEIAKEILAAPLQSAVDKCEKIVWVQEQPTSTTTVQTADEQETLTTITNITEQEITTQEQIEQQLSQPLQVIGDDYPWYSNYYTIADADGKLGPLYEALTNTVEQLEQRPPPTIVKFQPEPHERVVIPDDDHQTLTETKDTRAKVHELAQISASLTSSLTPTQDEQINDEDGFQVVQHRKCAPSSTTQQETSSYTQITSETTPSPDIDLIPVVIHGHPVSPTGTMSTSASENSTITSSTNLSISDTNKHESDTVKSEVVEEHTEITQPQVLPCVHTDDSTEIEQSLPTAKHEIDHASDDIKHELDHPSTEIKHQQDQPLEEI